MKKLIIIAGIVLASYSHLKAQTTNNAVTEHDISVKAKDDAVKAEVIDPAEEAAGGEAPDWASLTRTIAQKYDGVTADRTVTKAKIYFYYNKDWPQFCAGIVHYTDNYELANDYKLLNGNAGMILKNSTDAAQLKEALKWAGAAMNGDRNNENYKAAYRALKEKTGQ